MDMFREVADGVLVATSAKMATTSTVLVADGRALLIDPAWMPKELAQIASCLEARGLQVVGGFSTHAHHDHLLWHPAFGDAPRWSSRATAELARSERATLVEYLGPDFPADLVDLMGRVEGVSASIPESSVPRGFDPELIVHNGHGPGHTALWLPKQRVIIAGDMLSDIELPLPFWPDDVPAYMEALDLLADVAGRADVVIPGHGSPGADALARLDADRRFIDDVMNGREPDDPRVHNPGMREALEHLREIATS
jgi:glyoxylase-like metal-dependent hydrolase (beta-lactamase superfamily II)